MSTHMLSVSRSRKVPGEIKMRCGLSARDARAEDMDSPEAMVDGDTGTSSITIWSVMMGRPMPRGRAPSVPHDPDDFSRCHALLELFPAWRGRLAEVAAEHPDWAGLCGAWAELEELYLAERPTGNAPLLYARMRVLIDARQDLGAAMSRGEACRRCEGGGLDPTDYTPSGERRLCRRCSGRGGEPERPLYPDGRGQS
jgi:hypothetical protein